MSHFRRDKDPPSPEERAPYWRQARSISLHSRRHVKGKKMKSRISFVYKNTAYDITILAVQHYYMKMFCVTCAKLVSIAITKTL